MSIRLTQRLETRYLLPQVLVQKRASSNRRTLEELNAILPPLVSALAGGAPVTEALDLACESASGELAARLRFACSNSKLGERFEKALENALGKVSEPAVQELATKLVTAHRLGTGLVQQLSALSNSVDEELHQTSLRRASKRENRMLLPLVFLILPITVAFALYPSLVIIQNTY